MIKVGILTSSRADYGIYLPLLKALRNDVSFELKIIVFGTHLSKYHGFTVDQIEQDGFPIYKRIESLLIGDSPNAIASSYALTSLKFAEFWGQNHFDFDVVFALGDRFEMAAAVAAAIPYQIKFAHLFGGETTLGAIDNIYRHFISLSSQVHFVSTEIFKERLSQLIEVGKNNIYNIGSLSLENLDSLHLLSIDEFKEKWGIDLSLDTLLVTVHPETVNFHQNAHYCDQVKSALGELAAIYQIVITMPNADTAGLIYREEFKILAKQNSSVKLIENFGTQSYFTCMKYSKLMIGNTSSGIVEAATFHKYVLNLGDRQKGRLSGENVIHIPFDSTQIFREANVYSGKKFDGVNIYFQPNPSKKILKVIKRYYATFS